MPLEPQAYRKTAYTHRRGERADQPSVSDVLPGTLYYVTDEAVLERSNGIEWESYGNQGSVTSNLVKYTYSAVTTSPPASKQVRFNDGHPYTTVTALYFDNITLDSENIRVGLLRVPIGSLIYVQDRNDDTKYATFLTTAVPTDNTTWVKFDVIHYANGAAIGGGSQVIVQSTWGPGASSTLTAGSVLFAGSTGVPTQDNANFFWDDTNNRLGIGLNTGLLSSIVVNHFATAEEAPDTSTVSLHVQGNFDGSSGGIGHIFADGFGAQPILSMRRANGTQASKTALAANDIIFNFRALGYHSGGAYSGVRATCRVIATEAWTSTANGCAWVWFVTANGAVAATERMRLQNSGGLSIGSVASDPGVGALLVTNMIKMAGITATEVALKRSTVVLQTRLADDSAFAQHSALEFMNNRANFLMRTAVTWNNGAAAQAGTLTNAPTAGNPTKWIPVDDNGTTRYIPAW